MLKTLHIENVAVIEKADIQFMAGFNVLTGETGAGKSIIIDSLWAILGARTSRELIRHGQNKAVVSALFSPLSPAAAAKAEELGFPPEDDTLLISREIVQDGRNTCRINGRPASVSILRQLGETLVNIHGQNAGIALLDENSHMDYLDSFGGYQDVLEEYYAQYRQLLELRRSIKEKMKQNALLQQREDLLRFRWEEIKSAALQPGEYERLRQRRLLLGNQENIWMSKAFLYYVAGRLEMETRVVPRRRERTDLLHNILLYIQENFQQEISLSSMALSLGYSPVYCSRYLNQTVNQSFAELVNRHRISYGAYLLEHTEDTVSDIAFACGYSAIRSFNRNFKALEGVTPREYRNGARSAL